MALYKVYYTGFYYIRAESADEALYSDRSDYEASSDEWENIEAEEAEEVDADDEI